MSMSNVIDLEERRRQRARVQEPQQTEESVRGANILAAAGFVLAVPSLAFLGFVAYQAIRLQILGDTFVIALVAAIGGYLAVGATLMRFGSRRAAVSHRAREEKTTEVVPESDEDEDNSKILEFPAPSPIGPLISMRCASCASRYMAPVTDLACPSCGRGAMAG